MTGDAAMEARIASRKRMQRNPTQENFDACVALLTAQRVLGILDADDYRGRMKHFAAAWPQFAQKPVPRKIDTST